MSMKRGHTIQQIGNGQAFTYLFESSESFRAIAELMTPPEKSKKKTGVEVKEKRATYGKLKKTRKTKL